jgi:hypothetical protein
MKWGFQTVIIKTLTTTVTEGDAVESWDTGVTARASVTQVDGARYLKEEELVDRSVYKVELWDNSYSNNIKMEYGDLTLYPIRPWTKNDDRSTRVVGTIIMATKI